MFHYVSLWTLKHIRFNNLKLCACWRDSLHADAVANGSSDVILLQQVIAVTCP